MQLAQKRMLHRFRGIVDQVAKRALQRFGVCKDERQTMRKIAHEADGLEAAEKVLANKGMDGLLGKRKTNVRVEIALPRFKITSGFELNDPLKKMGMTDAFSSHADFSGLTEIRPAFLSRVMHSVLIETDEKGTEAAAVMVAMVGAAIQRVPPENVSFRADHPFLFMITHADTGAILFVGHVVDPSAE